MMNWSDLKLLLAVGFGLLLSLLLSRADTWRARAICVVAGSVSAYFGTEPLVNWAGPTFETSGWPYVIAGALAMSGDRLVRRILQIVEFGELPGRKP